MFINKVVLVLWILTSCDQGGAIKCFTGFQILRKGEVVSNTVVKQTCPSPNHSCFAVDAHVTIEGKEYVVFMGSCESYCDRKVDQEGCRDLELKYDGKGQYNVNRCDVSCCDWTNYCNLKVRPPPYREPSAKSVNSPQCISGMRHRAGNKTLHDSSRKITCPLDDNQDPSDVSCMKTRVYTADDHTLEIFECYPTSKCANYNCDFIKEALPSYLQETVVDCETSCCTGNGCNRAVSRQIDKIFLLILMLAVFLTLR